MKDYFKSLEDSKKSLDGMVKGFIKMNEETYKTSSILKTLDKYKFTSSSFVENSKGFDLGKSMFDVFLSSLSPKIKKLNTIFTSFSQITNLSDASTFINGFIVGFKSLISIFYKGLNGGLLIFKSLLSSLGLSLGPLITIILGVIFAIKALSSAWKVNAGGMQTTANVLRGKWSQGMAKINLEFLKLGRALAPILRPLSKIIEIIGSSLIDAIVGLIGGFTQLITIIVSFVDVLVGGFEYAFGQLLNFIGTLFLNDTLKSQGQEMIKTGSSSIESGVSNLKSLFGSESGTSTIQNNNITFNMNNSSIDEDAYLVFSNKILQVIG